MSQPRQKIAVVTGSRAEYGLLYWVLHDLRHQENVDLQLIVTGSHLSPEFGMTVHEIEHDGFTVHARVEMLLSSDTPGGTAKSMGLGIMGMSDALERLHPDIVLVLGDRFEILAAVQACLVHNIPVAHIAGGDTTEGAFDESIRHAITKMAHVHLVTNTLSAQRVLQMGEDPRHVHIVGSPGIDHLHRLTLLARPELESALGAPLGARNLLITFHPVTLEPLESERQFGELLAALDKAEASSTLWFTKPNADSGGRALASMLDTWAEQRKNRVRVHTSLGQLRYLSLMAHVDAVIGNSSSGLYEAPSFKVPTINLGDRQRGRLSAKSVIHCEPEGAHILAALAHARTLDCKDVVNPYGEGRSASLIVDVLTHLPPSQALLKKHFHLMGDLS